MISIHPNFVEMIRDPFCKNEIFKFTPRSIAIEGLYAKYLKDAKCLIEELDKDDKTQILALCLAKGVKLQRLLGGNPMNKIYFLPFAFCFCVFKQLCYRYDCVFCVLISVCAKWNLQDLLG